MPITSTLSDNQRQVTITVSGRFDFSNHQDFIKAYKGYPKGEKDFIVELSKAEYLDSSAMGMLLQLREHSTKGQNCVTLANCNEAILEIIRIANFHKLFTIS
jgi:HptB-dependent secretion and biofilm anti anti-sigma factor